MWSHFVNAIPDPILRLADWLIIIITTQVTLVHLIISLLGRWAVGVLHVWVADEVRCLWSLHQLLLAFVFILFDLSEWHVNQVLAVIFIPFLNFFWCFNLLLVLIKFLINLVNQLMMFKLLTVIISKGNRGGVLSRNLIQMPRRLEGHV